MLVSGGLFDLESMERDIAEFDELMGEPGFWDDGIKAQNVINEANIIKEKYNQFQQLAETKEELDLLLEMVKEEEDAELEKELEENLTTFLAVLDQFELDMLLSEPYDKNNAIIELHPGVMEQSRKIGVVCYYECIQDGQRKRL